MVVSVFGFVRAVAEACARHVTSVAETKPEGCRPKTSSDERSPSEEANDYIWLEKRERVKEKQGQRVHVRP